MGVYPEPALCADDVNRLVPHGSYDAHSPARKATRHAAPVRQTILPSLPRRSRGALLALLVGLALGGAAHAGTATIAPTPFATELRLGDAAFEWGGEPLLDQEPTTLAIIESDVSDLSNPRSASGGEILRFGDQTVPRQLAETIVRAAEATGVDPIYMMALADKESRFDTDVKNPASSAQGLFQFVSGTWLEMIRDYGTKYGFAAEAAAVGRRAAVSDAGVKKRILALRDDPYVAGLMAGELIKRDRAKIEGRIGRELKTTELYLAHFFGTASAGKFLSLSAEKPEKVASSEFRGAARANRSLFVAKDGTKRRALTVAELHERIDGMIDKRISQYEGITKLTVQPAEGEQTVENAATILKADAPVLDARLRIKDSAIPAVE